MRRKGSSVAIICCLLMRHQLVKAEFFAQKFLSSVDEALSNGKSCREHLKIFEAALRSGNGTWADDMLGSWSKHPEVLRYGNSIDFGQFDLCTSIHHDEIFTGKYCLVQFRSATNSTIPQTPRRSMFNYGWGRLDRSFGGAVCIPSTCSSATAHQLARNMLNETSYEVVDDYDQNKYCKTPSEGFKISKSLLLMGCTVLALLALSVTGTIHDLIGSRTNNFLMSFSLHKNVANLLNMEPPNDTIKCLHGIRALSIVSIVFLHSYYHRALFPVQHPQQLAAFAESFYGRFVISITVSVESFFVMSGMLQTRTVLKELTADRFNILKHYFQRYMRLTPSVALVVLASICSGEYFTHYAPYAFRKDLVEPCETWWWSTLLHLQVYTNPHQLCMPSTWFLSVEWQMFLVAPILIYPIWRIGHKNLSLLLPAVIATSCYFCFQKSLQSGLLMRDLEITTNSDEAFFQDFYLPTHFRGTTFVIGMVLGFVLYTRRDAKFVISRRLKIILWTLSFSALSLIGLTFILKYWDDQTSPVLNAFFLIAYRNIWALSMAWFIFAFECGSWKWLGDVLSHKLWMPLGRLGLSLYLVHPALQIALLSSQKYPISYDSFQMLANFFGDITMSIILAGLLHLLVEEPFTQVGKLLTKNWHKSTLAKV